MSEEQCTHDCSSCSLNCDGKTAAQDFQEKAHPMSRIKKVIGIISGKGGVGKSLVTAQLASTMRKKGYEVGILDADITGPSIPKAFGITEKAQGSEMGLLPVVTPSGIDVMSMNLLLEDDTDPVIWRGPVIAGAVKQFWTDVIWSYEDFLFVDMPPGTGDVPLTVFQFIPVDGIIVVTSPQELVSLIVEKAVKMAELMNIPILGIVENMSYFKCPNCDTCVNIFGESHIEKIAEEKGLKVLAKVPIDPQIAQLVDAGRIEDYEGDYFNRAAEVIEAL